MPNEDPNFQPTTFTIFDRLLLQKLVITTDSTIKLLESHLKVDAEYKKVNDATLLEVKTDTAVAKKFGKVLAWTIGIIGLLTSIVMAFNLI